MESPGQNANHELSAEPLRPEARGKGKAFPLDQLNISILYSPAFQVVAAGFASPDDVTGHAPWERPFLEDLTLEFI